MIWSSIGKFGTLGLNFISNMVLARLLSASDYGIIGMLSIFISVSSVLVSAGFGSALIQKKNPSHVDFTSVFYWNLAAALVFYGLLFLSGPFIARFYDMPELCIVLRVQSVSLIIQAFSTVQSCQLQKQLRFRELSVRSIVATLIGTVVGIVFAFMGYGVWSLVLSNISANLAGVFLLWYLSSWRPSLEFSFKSLKELFSFGGLIALSSLVETVYSNIQGLIIGKWFSASDLGYYTQARKLEEIPTSSLSQIVNQVSFPVFSALQDDRQRLLQGVRKNIKAITYLNFPMMVLLMVIAKPLILTLYGDKWLVSVPYFRVLCISSMVYTLNTLNTNVIKSLGKGRLFFFVQLLKRVIGLAVIFFSIRFGINGLLWAVTSVGYICVVINMAVNKRLIGYGFREQVQDVGYCYVVSALLGLFVYEICKLIPLSQFVVMFIAVIIYIVLYLLASRVLHFEGYETYSAILRERLEKYRYGKNQAN